jgi:alkanesulfonate monooxygenase SsuD/methylene tetrahydromethanopterin reductase-like flavin-dependent oxidoreductase (luciferase family)
MSISDAEVDQFVERIRAERAAAGRPPTIQCPAGYRILAAVLTAAAEKQQKPIKD